jgi:hypothetical protein
MMMLYLS